MCISKHNLAPISRNIFGHNATSQSAGSTFLVGIKPVTRSVEMSGPLLCEVLKDCTSLSGLEQLQKLLSQQFVVGDTTHSILAGGLANAYASCGCHQHSLAPLVCRIMADHVNSESKPHGCMYLCIYFQLVYLDNLNAGLLR